MGPLKFAVAMLETTLIPASEKSERLLPYARAARSADRSKFARDMFLSCWRSGTVAVQAGTLGAAANVDLPSSLHEQAVFDWSSDGVTIDPRRGEETNPHGHPRYDDRGHLTFDPPSMAQAHPAVDKDLLAVQIGTDVQVRKADLDAWVEYWSVSKQAVVAADDQVRTDIDRASSKQPALPTKSATVADSPMARRRGPAPQKLLSVKAAMADFDRAILDTMTEEAMAAQFKASRDTCRRARRELSEFK
ncbi:hypothetical protein [Mesorhizobium sp. B2-3-15]|uniref:hypothetical protein n=1 Tax=Mesorhizobium sp. B2-3-15 TaxID=2589949 RepID=UPI0011298004|nr:hypothetical protein [Mesorhizobium sp. B2-3-15]TPL67545.1 hypothetical protein FJ954_24785 [Mesorhizobium sp. B2-3-15]